MDSPPGSKWPGIDNVVELIAHEIEHVIEQIDRVDLAESAAGIYSVSAGGMVFETERAGRAGRQRRTGGARVTAA